MTILHGQRPAARGPGPESAARSGPAGCSGASTSIPLTRAPMESSEQKAEIAFVAGHVQTWYRHGQALPESTPAVRRAGSMLSRVRCTWRSSLAQQRGRWIPSPRSNSYIQAGALGIGQPPPFFPGHPGPPGRGLSPFFVGSRSARCCRRLRGSTLNAQLSMGSRPRLSAAAASRLHSIPRAGARGLFSPDSFRPRRTVASGRFHRLTPSATCCRCLRGSTLTPSFPWADAHG